ncbi:MAG: UDP-3-O-acyl-N-acetylglucosamine deacetylase [Betaproteobacteria bacterium]|nr:UDP-3-O-acyl-N-acetylglucosamine deacetylase [Betaproteobacteria bacterium]
MIRQRTLKAPVTATGVGLHSGAKVTITLRPAAPNAGVTFRRLDLSNAADLKVGATKVTDTRLCSALVEGAVKVSTVEHLMSALAGLGVDNVLIDLDGPEVPIMDGSANTFVYLLQSVGFVDQPAPKRFLQILKTVEVSDGDKWARLDPFDGFKLTFSIQFDHPAVERTAQALTIDLAKVSYARDIARARTFGFVQEVEALRDIGLIQGGNLDNAVVVDEYRVLNAEGLRYADEFVKHKVLDAIGDLFLVGFPIIGAFSAHKSGHELNNRLLRAVLAEEASHRIISFENSAEAPRTVLDWVLKAA